MFILVSIKICVDTCRTMQAVQSANALIFGKYEVFM
jgi:hypothetical protein